MWGANRTLSSPVLNISAFYFPLDYIASNVYGYNWTDPRTNQRPFKDVSRATYWVQRLNRTYSFQYLSTVGNAFCQPMGVGYRVRHYLKHSLTLVQDFRVGLFRSTARSCNCCLDHMDLGTLYNVAEGPTLRNVQESRYA